MPMNIATWPELNTAVCIVTGAGGGIGRQIALDLARCGAILTLIDVNAQSCEGVEQEVRSLGARCRSAALDLTDRGAVEIVAAASREEFGPCKVLVNTIAISGRPDSLLDIDPAKWERQIAVNLTSCFSTAQIFGRQMRDAGGGSMIHISSLAGQFPQPNSGAYSVCKAGLAMMSRVFSLELGQFGIRSNVVSPALVRTPLSEKFYGDPDVLARREQMVPIGRISTPADVSQAVLFLASDRSSYMTGQDLLLDGGLSQKLMGLFPRPADKA